MVTIVFVATTSIFSVAFPIDLFMAVVGGLCTVTIDFVIPMYSYIKLSEQEWYQGKNLLLTMLFGPLILIGYISVLTSIYLGVTRIIE